MNYTQKHEKEEKSVDSRYTPEVDEDDSASKSTSPGKIRECHVKHENEDDDCHSHALMLENRKHKISTYTLEFGISIHSVIIGIALGLAKGEFIALFIAILFHQFFEGIGLGYMLAEVTFAEGYSFLVWINALFYGVTTPLGVAIGIILHNTAVSETSSLIVTGMLDSISAGILLYTALVTLVSKAYQTPKFLAQENWEKGLCFFSLYLGSGVMAILAIWA
jgi:zinc transporter 1/2/3